MSKFGYGSPQQPPMLLGNLMYAVPDFLEVVTKRAIASGLASSEAELKEMLSGKGNDFNIQIMDGDKPVELPDQDTNPNDAKQLMQKKIIQPKIRLIASNPEITTDAKTKERIDNFFDSLGENMTLTMAGLRFKDDFTAEGLPVLDIDGGIQKLAELAKSLAEKPAPGKGTDVTTQETASLSISKPTIPSSELQKMKPPVGPATSKLVTERKENLSKKEKEGNIPGHN